MAAAKITLNKVLEDFGWFIAIILGTYLLCRILIWINIYTGWWIIKEYSLTKYTIPQVGDSFGLINALFSGLAFLIITITMILQKKELELQRKELKDTRTEFVVNRITTVIYKQIDFISSVISKQSTRSRPPAPDENQGNEYIRWLSEHLKTYFGNKINVDSDDTKITVQSARSLGSILLSHDKAITEVINSVYKSAEVLRKLLNVDTIDKNDNAQLVFIFVTNIGKEVIHLIEYSNKISSLIVNSIEADVKIKNIHTLSNNCFNEFKTMDHTLFEK